MIFIRHLLSGAALSAAVLMLGCGGAVKKEPSTTAFYTPDETNEDQILISEAPPAPAPKPDPASARAKPPEVAAADGEATEGGEMVFGDEAAPEAKATPAKKERRSRRHRKHR